ncbi:MAG TPA: phospholipase D family protein [Gemmatimonadales bacterium]|nr:phospholipase D family protein [Gemmatimonadales bacterium]
MTDETPDDVAPDLDPTLNGVPTTGLHAKVYVADYGGQGRVWTGSANATNAAFGRNVEFLIELRRKKSHCGVEAVLNSGTRDVALSEFLQLYEPQEALPVDKDLEALDDLLDEIRRRIVALDLAAHVSEAANGYLVKLRTQATKRKAVLEGVSLRVWPVTLPEASAATEPDVTNELVASFSGVSFESLTAFFAFEAAGKKGKATLARRFVLNLPLHGAPADRKERILRYLLRDQRQVLRFILFLLGDADSQQALPIGATGEGPSAAGGARLAERATVGYITPEGPSSPRRTMVRNDSILFFPIGRVGERRCSAGRRSGVDRRHASVPGPAEWRRGARRLLADRRRGTERRRHTTAEWPAAGDSTRAP